MQPNEPISVPVDPTFTALVRKLMTFYQTDVADDPTGITVKHHAEVAARDIMSESLAMVERYAQSRSSIAKYDLLKWVGNKRSEVRLYK